MKNSNEFQKNGIIMKVPQIWINSKELFWHKDQILNAKFFNKLSRFSQPIVMG